MDKTDVRYYEIEYFSYRPDKICKTIVRAVSFVSAIYAFNKPGDILSIKLLIDKSELKTLYSQDNRKPDIAALAEKIERNEKRINDLEIYYNRLNARLNELWDNFDAFKYDLNGDPEQ